MNIIVCVKQIPDPAAPGALNSDSNTLKRDGKLVIDDSDMYGVEMALQLVDAAGGGEVSLVSMAPNGETSGMRTALAMGAAKGVLVSDPALQGSDALTTAKILAAAVQRLGGADLIVAATESSDGYTGTVPEQMAEVLGLPSVTFTKENCHQRLNASGITPNRSRLRRSYMHTSCCDQRDCWSCRTSVPIVQGNHGCQEQASRTSHCI